MGLNPAWRNGLAYTTIGSAWPEGASLTEIDAVRQVIIQDMKILEALAPESGAYLNEVRAPHIHSILQVLSLILSPCRAPTGIAIRIRLEEIVLRISL